MQAVATVTVSHGDGSQTIFFVPEGDLEDKVMDNLYDLIGMENSVIEPMP